MISKEEVHEFLMENIDTKYIPYEYLSNQEQKEMLNEVYAEMQLQGSGIFTFNSKYVRVGKIGSLVINWGT